jgi:hypothetical protein
MMNQDFIERLFVDSINIMETDKWQWPEHWNGERRLRFLDESLRFAEERELFEQCVIIRDVKESIGKI